jgi:hypothetical protein
MNLTVSRHLRLIAGAVLLLAAGILALRADRAAASPVQVAVLVAKATWGPQPYADADVNTVMQGVERFYAVASFGQVAISYSQTPWLDVMPGPLSCSDETQQLPQLAASTGWDTSAYDRVVFLVPDGRPSGCLSTFDDPSGVLLNGTLAVGTVIHEFGHSFGMGHAGLLTCWYVQARRLCSGDPYGDTSDVMGGEGGSNVLAYVGDFGALQKARAGWLTPRYITKPGTYRLAPLEAATTLAQALVIRGTAYEYWIDERAPVGNDVHLAGLPVTTGFTASARTRSLPAQTR